MTYGRSIKMTFLDSNLQMQNRHTHTEMSSSYTWALEYTENGASSLFVLKRLIVWKARHVWFVFTLSFTLLHEGLSSWNNVRCLDIYCSACTGRPDMMLSSGWIQITLAGLCLLTPLTRCTQCHGRVWGNSENHHLSEVFPQWTMTYCKYNCSSGAV